MVLEVLTHASQIGDDRYAVPREIGAWTHTGQEQDLGRFDGSGREHDLAARADDARFAALHGLDAGRAVSLERHAKNVRAAENGQIPTFHRREEKCVCGAPPGSTLLRYLVVARAVLRPVVEIITPRNA